MPKFVTIGYGDEAGYNRITEDLRASAHAQDAALKAAGAVIGRAGQPVQVRNPDATGPRARTGAFMEAALPLAGFAIIEAADIDEAIRKVSLVPCAVAHGVVEIWPLLET